MLKGDNMSQLENFRLRLEQLKEQGVDINPEKITQEVIQAQTIPEDTSEEDKAEELFKLAKQRIVGLLVDWKNHYRPKGRKLKVWVRIEKDNSADAYGEKFVYDDDLEVVSVIEIGTKGKYEKPLEEK